ncbi:protein of unknown function [Acetoanaerobium sticklandii]|uniref:Uncharacterized protein n=1 Tax=Acetoanaerobium sticklandii (strain ATCC 12662 / DSM 519 / JCM 1433 / CCUG 9281 / NCIMB 10654 / HF) TaxID=499177 RepID=E3PRZ9_ACESD|nr:hypothetical protein [Acetoanaerobium sticklandii]CBH21653.1 protein of unknown function [Acetoanaerobium sticklandii]
MTEYERESLEILKNIQRTVNDIYNMNIERKIDKLDKDIQYNKSLLDEITKTLNEVKDNVENII